VFKRRSLRVSAGWLSVVELIVLVPASGLLVFGVVPSAFDVEWSCLGGFGVQRTDGDTYLAGFATIMGAGWFLVLVAIVYAEISDKQRAAAVIPVVWFAILVAISVVSAAAIGPELCPA
jgi:amino acid transporter